MKRIVVDLPHRVKVRIRRLRRTTRNAGLAQRCQIILHAAKGRSSREIGEALGCSRSWASRVIQCFSDHGEAGLFDRREDNGTLKLDDWYLGQLYELVEQRPTDHGFTRPTWTRELLVKVMRRRTGVKIHVGTMSRALKQIGARRGRPRPTVRCPWSKSAKNKRLKRIRSILEELPPDEVVVYEDEVDIHLNPKIGLDWMNYGEQKEVVTPGQNEKRHIAGTIDARTGHITWVEADKKDSMLFIVLLHELRHQYPEATKIHLILDNCRIHKSELTKSVIAYLGGQIVLHFLPPYCPQENKIERLWEDLHGEVTRNHTCMTMSQLMRRVRKFLWVRNHRSSLQTKKPAA